jgi:predicted RNA-binding Zn-ribbon protein involved in translation (DUF1610 family)
MVTTGQRTAYRCDQCGSAEIVALSLLYEQGTRSFSGRFTSGVSQSIAAKAAAPPAPKHYFRPFILWGSVVAFFAMWTYVGFSALFMHPKALALKECWAAVLLTLCMTSFVKLLLNLYLIARYNQEVYPRLHSDWAHTFMCRRCGRYSLIRS